MEGDSGLYPGRPSGTLFVYDPERVVHSREHEHADGAMAIPGRLGEASAGGEGSRPVALPAVREEVPEARRTLRHAAKDPDRGARRPRSGERERTTHGALRPLPSPLRQLSARRPQRTRAAPHPVPLEFLIRCALPTRRNSIAPVPRCEGSLIVPYPTRCGTRPSEPPPSTHSVLRSRTACAHRRSNSPSPSPWRQTGVAQRRRS